MEYFTTTTLPGSQKGQDNKATFAQASRAAHLLRQAFRKIIYNAADKFTQGRMLKICKQVISTAKANEEGTKRMKNGDGSLLEGFQFNRVSNYIGYLFTQTKVKINRKSGAIAITMPLLLPGDWEPVRLDATHARIVAAAAAINFEEGSYEYNEEATAEWPCKRPPQSLVGFDLTLPVTGNDVIIVVLAIAFYTCVNGRYHRLGSRELNTCIVVKVDALKD
jgi:hypothetical protein